MRTDLRDSEGHKVNKGKLIAQGGHAFVGLICNYIYLHKEGSGLQYVESFECYGALYEWLTGSFTKIVLGVDSEEELAGIYFKAQAAGLNVVDIVDNGETVFGRPTFTCIGIGPDWEDKIDAITGHLKGFS